MTTPLVSIVIPNYNHALYLEQRIQSVLNQTHQDFEVLILDDCSTDNSLDIIEQYGLDSRVQIFYNSVNSGSVFKQWEKGVNLAQGKYIWIAESDDYADPNFLSELIPVIESDKEIGLVYCDTHIVKDEKLWYRSSLDKNRRFNTDKWSKSYIVPGQKEIQETLLKRCSINNASAVVFRKSYLISLFPLPYPFKLSGDYFIYIALAHTYKVAYLAKALNYYRAHNNNSFKPVGAVFLDEHFIIYNWMYNNSTSYLSRKEIAASFAETVAYPLVQTKKLFIRYFFVYLYKNYRFLWAFLKQIVYLYYKKFTQ